MTLEKEKNLTPKKVLVVDDERILRLVVKRQLEFQGYQVRDASSGEEALHLLKIAEAMYKSAEEDKEIKIS